MRKNKTRPWLIGVSALTLLLLLQVCRPDSDARSAYIIFFSSADLSG